MSIDPPVYKDIIDTKLEPLIKKGAISKRLAEPLANLLGDAFSTFGLSKSDVDHVLGSICNATIYIEKRVIWQGKRPYFSQAEYMSVRDYIFRVPATLLRRISPDFVSFLFRGYFDDVLNALWEKAILNGVTQSSKDETMRMAIADLLSGNDAAWKRIVETAIRPA